MNRAIYNSPRRQQAAAATREAIVDAAQELFAAQGYGRTTVAQIAELAQVAANTVYTSVGGKADLVTAGADHLGVASLTVKTSTVLHLTGSRVGGKLSTLSRSSPRLRSGWTPRRRATSS